MLTDQSVGHSVVMDNLICTDCGTTYYSAAARAMVVRGERCDCGGLLLLTEDDDPVAVGAEPGFGADRAPALVPRYINGRRFARDG